MKQEFKLNHYLNRPEVQRQIQWLIAHPSYTNQLYEAKPYIYHIVSEIKKRHLPGELALIPMIESTYDPFAYSGAGAAGLWQLMPMTGKDLGLKRDWWNDSRRSITPSTQAALNYLTYLNKFFKGHWELAIAAYDAGEGTIAKAIKNAGQTLERVDVWALPIPRETQIYLPRLLALAEIISHPERYRLHLPNIEHTPYFKEVKLQKHIDLNHAAKLAGISYKELIKLNPGFNRATTTPNKPSTLLIPAQKVNLFYENLALDSMKNKPNLSHYHVKTTTPLNTLAKHFNTTPETLKTLNQLKSDTVYAGDVLLIPTSKPSIKFKEIHKEIKPKTIKIIHIVQEKDSLGAIARKYHVREADIRAWNHLQNTTLQKKQQIMIWKIVDKS